MLEVLELELLLDELLLVLLLLLLLLPLLLLPLLLPLLQPLLLLLLLMLLPLAVQKRLLFLLLQKATWWERTEADLRLHQLRVAELRLPNEMLEGGLRRSALCNLLCQLLALLPLHHHLGPLLHRHLWLLNDLLLHLRLRRLLVDECLFHQKPHRL